MHTLVTWLAYASARSQVQLQEGGRGAPLDWWTERYQYDAHTPSYGFGPAGQRSMAGSKSRPACEHIARSMPSGFAMRSSASTTTGCFLHAWHPEVCACAMPRGTMVSHGAASVQCVLARTAATRCRIMIDRNIKQQDDAMTATLAAISLSTPRNGQMIARARSDTGWS